uniref:Uncharacterized protein n=1 Tax=Acrobeloides nanus TaxID=290746 RepID=A0A914D4D1_9BILA
MLFEVLCLVGCSTFSGLTSLKFNTTTGKFELFEVYNVTDVSYFAQASPNYVYVLGRQTPNNTLMRYHLSSETPGKLVYDESIALSENGACYLNSNNLNNSAERLAIAYYNDGAVQFFDDNITIQNGFEEGPKLKFMNFSNVDPSRQEAPHEH